MSARRRVLPALLGLVALVVVAGCSGRPSIRPASPVDPTWRPLPSAVPATTLPSPPHGEPSLAAVRRASRAGPGRAEAEQFAMEAAHALIDVRGDADPERVVRELVIDDFDPHLAAYLRKQINELRQLHLLRQFDPHREMWVRSSITGPEAEPDRVDVEIAGSLMAANDAEVRMWYRTRYDVVREDDHWRLADFREGLAGPIDDADLTRREQAQFLTGPGWRRIPPASR